MENIPPSIPDAEEPHENLVVDGVKPRREAWKTDPFLTTAAEKFVRRTLRKIYIIAGIGLFILLPLTSLTGYFLYKYWNTTDTVQPDYTLLEPESDVYWIKRITLDIETAENSSDTDELFQQRIRRFVRQTLADVQQIPSAVNRARAVSNIAVVLFRHNLDLVPEEQLQRLGDTRPIVSLRCRALVSQALMLLRLEKLPAANQVIQEYRRLKILAAISLNSKENEESFFGAVTVLQFLGESEALTDMFDREIRLAAIMERNRRVRSYRLIAGEQVRTGFMTEAWNTSNRIVLSHAELARAWELILHCTARPPQLRLTEPAMLELPTAPPTGELPFPEPTAKIADKIMQTLADRNNAEDQLAVLRRIAGSRLMYDAAMHKLFRERIDQSRVLDTSVKRQILNLLDQPESPSIRAALKMPPLPPQAPLTDTALNEEEIPEETLTAGTVAADSSPLYALADRQFIRMYLAVAQAYLSVRRDADADNVLRRTVAAAQTVADTAVRNELLMRIGEQQAAAGLTAGAVQTFAHIALPDLTPAQKADLARMQITLRFLTDAGKTLDSMPNGAAGLELRDNACRLLLQEQIRIRQLDIAAKTLARMSPSSKAAGECRSLLSIAQGTGKQGDYDALQILPPENLPPEKIAAACTEYMVNGLLPLAAQTAAAVTDADKRLEIRRRIARSLNQVVSAYNDINDPKYAVRDSLRSVLLTYLPKLAEPAAQAALMTELLADMTEDMKAEREQNASRQIWQQAWDLCRKITVAEDQSRAASQLIVLKILLEKPLNKKDVPFLTEKTDPAKYAEINKWIQECRKSVNAAGTAASGAASSAASKQALTCVFLAKALQQIGDLASAGSMLESAGTFFGKVADVEEKVPLMLTMSSLLKGYPAKDWVLSRYQETMDAVAAAYTNRQSAVSVVDWRMQDSEMERLIRSQMENGFVAEAVQGTVRLNDPAYKDRILRAAVYIYLDQENVDLAEFLADRLSKPETFSAAPDWNIVRNQETVQHILLFKQRRKF